MRYPIVEVFQSIQGEGHHVGRAATFIRLAGCPNRCGFCDTDIERKYTSTEEDLVDQVNWEAPLVVITGGEPVMHDLAPLVTALATARKDRPEPSRTKICLETSGVRRIISGFDWITLSPKIGKFIPYTNFKYVDEVKWLVPMWSLPEIKAAREAFQPNTMHFVQPINGAHHLDPINVNVAIKDIQLEPWLRLSIQLHKIINAR